MNASLPTMPITFRRRGASSIGRLSGKPRRHAGRHRGGSEGEREVSADGLADPRGIAGGGEAGSWPDRQTPGDVARAAGAGRKTQPDLLRAQCVEMRDFVVRIRKHTAMQFAAPVVKGLSAVLAAADELEVPPVQRAPAGISIATRCGRRPTRRRWCRRSRDIPGCDQEAASRCGGAHAESPGRRYRSGGSGRRARPL